MPLQISIWLKTTKTRISCLPWGVFGTGQDEKTYEFDSRSVLRSYIPRILEAGVSLNNPNLAQNSVSGKSESQKYSSIALNITPALFHSYGKYETSRCSQIASTLSTSNEEMKTLEKGRKVSHKELNKV
jgi:hypothetical protein